MHRAEPFGVYRLSADAGGRGEKRCSACKAGPDKGNFFPTGVNFPSQRGPLRLSHWPPPPKSFIFSARAIGDHAEGLAGEVHQRVQAPRGESKPLEGFKMKKKALKKGKKLSGAKTLGGPPIA